MLIDSAVEHPWGGLTQITLEKALGGLLQLSRAFPFTVAGAARSTGLRSSMGTGDEIHSRDRVIARFFQAVSAYELGLGGSLGDSGPWGGEGVDHSVLLERDIRALLGGVPEFSGNDETREMLERLEVALSSVDLETQVGGFAAFDYSSRQMIRALADSISGAFCVSTDSLPYFYCHFYPLSDSPLGPMLAHSPEMRAVMTEVDVQGPTFSRQYDRTAADLQVWCADVVSAAK